MVYVIRKSIRQKCPKCGNALLDNHGELYCLCCGSSPSILKATVTNSKIVCNNCGSKAIVELGKFKGI